MTLWFNSLSKIHCCPGRVLTLALKTTDEFLIFSTPSSSGEDMISKGKSLAKRESSVESKEHAASI
jgi:hypothetical protein